MPPSSVRVSVGQLLGEPFGDYILLRKLATGGMAEVFLARRRSVLPGFAKLVAVKRMLPHLAEDPEFITMFLDEARTASHLNHPNVVQIFDVGEALGTLYLGMEYLDGVSLMTLLQHNIDLRGAQAEAATRRFLPASEDDRPLEPLYSAAVGVQACEGLHYAHELRLQGEPMGLVHRDVSPQNLMLTFGGVVKVLDFGIAKAAGRASVTKAGALKGKLRYMAPEQFQFQPVDRRTDVYSLGVVLYELCTATRAFYGEDWEIVRQIQGGELPPARAVRAEVPAELEAVLARAMALRPEERYESAASLGEALLGVMRDLGKVLTPADLAQMALRRFGDGRIDLTPFMSSEHLAVPLPMEVRLSGARALAGGPETRMSATLPYGEPSPLVGWGVEPCNTGAVGSAPPAPALGLLLHGLLSLSMHFRPRLYFLYPTVLALLLAAALSALVGGLAPRRPATAGRATVIGARPTAGSRPALPVAPPPAPAPAAPAPAPAAGGGVAPAPAPAPAPAAPPAAAPPPVVPPPTTTPPPPPRPAPRAPRLGHGVGYLVLDSKPSWAKVYLRGQLLGQTPLVRRALPAGWVTLRVVNGQSRAERAVRVLVKRGEVTTTLVRWQ